MPMGATLVFELFAVYCLHEYIIRYSETYREKNLWDTIFMAYSTMIRVLTGDDIYSICVDISQDMSRATFILLLQIIQWKFLFLKNIKLPPPETKCPVKRQMA